MKKSIAIFSLALACAIAFCSTDAHASIINREASSPRSRDIAAVHHDFPQVQNISWLKQGKDFVARFSYLGSKITAVYDYDGRLLSSLIYSGASHIPFSFHKELYQEYPGYIPQCMEEYRITGKSLNYYFLLRRQKGNQVRWMNVKIDEDGHISVIRKLHETV